VDLKDLVLSFKMKFSNTVREAVREFNFKRGKEINLKIK